MILRHVLITPPVSNSLYSPSLPGFRKNGHIESISNKLSILSGPGLYPLQWLGAVNAELNSDTGVFELRKSLSDANILEAIKGIFQDFSVDYKLDEIHKLLIQNGRLP